MTQVYRVKSRRKRGRLRASSRSTLTSDADARRREPASRDTFVLYELYEPHRRSLRLFRFNDRHQDSDERIAIPESPPPRSRFLSPPSPSPLPAAKSADDKRRAVRQGSRAIRVRDSLQKAPLRLRILPTPTPPHTAARLEISEGGVGGFHDQRDERWALLPTSGSRRRIFPPRGPPPPLAMCFPDALR